MAKLSQILAIESGIKSSTDREVTELYKTIQKPALFEGRIRTYTPNDETGEKLPDERQKVQFNVEDILLRLSESMGDLFDVTARKDFGNVKAAANIVVDGSTIYESVPVPYLLFLSKKLTDLHTFVNKLPVQDLSEEWQNDPSLSVAKSSPTFQVRTKKVQRPVTLAKATENHAEQAVLVSEDVQIGRYETVRLSGATTPMRKKDLLGRISKLQRAVKFAREHANGAEVHKRQLAKPIFNYILGEG